MAETPIPFRFGTSGRSLNNIMFGSRPIDVLSLKTGVPTTANELLRLRNQEVLTILEAINIRAYSTQKARVYDTQAIGRQFGVSEDVLAGIEKLGIDRFHAQNKGMRAAKRFEMTKAAALAAIAAAWAFISAQALALLYTPAATLPAGTHGPVAPLSVTAKTTNTAITGLTGAGYSTAVGFGSKAVIGIFGNKIGGAILALFSGDFAGAVQIITTNPPGSPAPGGFAPIQIIQGGGGGGSGLGLGSKGNAGLSEINPVWYLAIGLALVGLVIWLFGRK